MSLFELMGVQRLVGALGSPSLAASKGSVRPWAREWLWWGPLGQDRAAQLTVDVGSWAGIWGLSRAPGPPHCTACP